MLKHRILTAIVLIPLTILGLFYLSPAWFCLLTGFITLGALWEWTNLMEVKKISSRILFLGLSILASLGVLVIPVPLILIFSFIWWVIASIFVICYPKASGWWQKSYVWRGLMGWFVLLPCWIAINFIRNQTDGVYALLFLFVLIWGADSAAYFVGKKWGKTKLAPQVSPGKSWQGFLGALAFSIVIVSLAIWLCEVPLMVWPWAIALSLVTVVFSVLGDLFESMLKRQANLKDSGKLLPGHGGLLDRIDSLTAAAPIFAFGALLLGTYL